MMRKGMPMSVKTVKPSSESRIAYPVDMKDMIVLLAHEKKGICIKANTNRVT